MSKKTIEVYIGSTEIKVGELDFHQQGNGSWTEFHYSPEWLEDGNRFPISPDLPLKRDWFPKKAQDDKDSVFPFAIQDSEPDGWAKKVIHRDFTKKKKEALKKGDPVQHSLTELDYLLWVDDVSRIGALRFKVDGIYQRHVTKSDRAAPPFIELASIFHATQAVERNKETPAELKYLQGKGTSLGGMRPKCSIMNEEGELCIGKFPSIQDERSITKGEVLCLKLAGLAGIDAADSKIVDVLGTAVAIIKRFDRTLTSATKAFSIQITGNGDSHPLSTSILFPTRKEN